MGLFFFDPAHGHAMKAQRIWAVPRSRCKYAGERTARIGARMNFQNLGRGLTTLQRVGAGLPGLLDRHHQRLELAQRFHETSGGRVGRVGRVTEMGEKPFGLPLNSTQVQVRSFSCREVAALLALRSPEHFPRDALRFRVAASYCLTAGIVDSPFIEG